MNRLALVPAAALAAVAFVAPAGAAVSPATQPTAFTLLTGSPEPGAAASRGVLLVPGTVLPLGADAGDTVRSSISLANETAGLADKLRQTLRLDRVEFEYRTNDVLELDQARDLPPVRPGSRVAPRVTLIGYNEELATYRVVFAEGDRILADTSVSIPYGRRSVIGGLDGDEAPYLFLVVQPPSREADDLEADRITPPRAVAKVPPAYPEDARKERLEGVVVIQTVIGKDGAIERTRVLKGVHPSLDRAAVEAVRQWRFEPALLDGKAVAVHYNLTINYRLDTEKEDS